MSGISNVRHLALSDYKHEWRMSACFVLALAAVLAPMMVLFGLKFGIVTSMVDQLVQDPRNREIRAIGSGHFDKAWFDALNAREEVAFAIPKTRAIAATMDLFSEKAGRIVPTELIPSAPGDPLIEDLDRHPEGYSTLILSQDAARKLEVDVGDRVDASIARRFDGKRERVHVNLTVAGIASAAAFGRDGAFVSLDMLNAAEDFRDGREVPVLNWSGDEPRGEDRHYPGYRLFAHSIYDVASLRDALEAQGLEVRTRAADIEVVQSIDRNLTIIFWIIAAVGLAGFSLSLGASLWANVDRKTRELSVLRLVGFRTSHIVWFPLYQGVFTGILGWALAAGLYFGIETSINTLFPDQAICVLLPEHYAGALGITLLSAIVSAFLGGWRAAGIEPSDGLREI
ncbi:MAG: ABC transporter permease [Gammaproteobacteria bacterium]